ncbi:hypothetical protein H0H81_007212 [Sphagnurus paluster]|uniref:Restriction of telomere capping protein 4 n=1 Tax=Sphagnurus paluster TaxID=117069 RepID=A0A9P7FX30_9AGAR|nr:hypothetical protein H0H81_007212 [Sphagnurus paluster]
MTKTIRHKDHVCNISAFLPPSPTCAARPYTLLDLLFSSMEGLVTKNNWKSGTAIDDPKLRLATRPTANTRSGSGSGQSKSDIALQGQRRKGATSEDYGSSFGKPKSSSSSQNKKKPVTKLKEPGESDDELDFLSNNGSAAGSPAKKKPKKDESTDAKSGDDTLFSAKCAEKSNVLKNLKFNKKKVNHSVDSTDASRATTQPIVLQDNNRNNNRASGSVHPPATPPQLQPTRPPNRTRARSPINNIVNPPQRHTRSTNPKYPSASLPDPTPATETTRPKPRPVPRPIGAVRAQQQQQPVNASPIPPDFDLIPLGKKPPASPARRATISGPKPFPFDDPSLLTSENKDGDKGNDASAKLKAAAFPLHDSPSFTSVSREKEKDAPAKKLKATAFPSLSPVKSGRVASDLSSEKKGMGKRSVSEKVEKAKPAAFPMSPPSGSKKAGTVERKKSSRVVLSSEEESDTEASRARMTAQPFPMSTQVLDSIGSPSIAGPSSLGKRLSTGSDDAHKSKKRKDVDVDEVLSLADSEYEEEYTITISPPADPSTLCPYCDAPLPPSPTPLLKSLLASAEKKSHREPRPENALGRGAPFTVFIAVCQRHRFENEVLPQAELKGWPKSIDWPALEQRVRRMEGLLRALVDDVPAPGVIDKDKDRDNMYIDMIDEEQEDSPRARSVFWREVMAEVKRKGSRAMAAVQGQFASFQKTQPGYYGELGLMIIHQTLYDLFPPASIAAEKVAPLTANEFVQRILVPEVGVRLVMDDMDLDEARVDEAVRIMRESATYGAQMFPADEKEEGGGGGTIRDNGKESVADLILIERARKRRKELEADELREEAEEKARGEKAEEERQRKAARKKEKEKEKQKEIEKPPPAPPPNARPRPRPLAKSASTTSVGDADLPPQQISSAEEGDTDVDVELSLPRPSRRRRELSRTASELAQLANATPKRRKINKVPSGVDLNLCSSAEESSDNVDATWDTGRLRKGTRKQLQKVHSVSDEDDDVSISSLPPSSSFYHTKPRSDVEDATPRVRDRSRPPEASSTVPPLLRAQQRSRPPL